MQLAGDRIHPGCDYGFALRAPGWPSEDVDGLMRNLPCRGAIHVRYPHVVVAARVAQIQKLTAIGAESGRTLHGRTAMDQRGLAPGRRNPIDISQQIEYQRAAVWTDIHTHPRAFCDREFSVDVRLPGTGHIPAGIGQCER